MIQLFHVTHAYGTDPPVLSDVTLEIGKGEFVFLTGPSGAGKSTLLKLMFLAERPSRGQILVAGLNLTRLPPAATPLLRRNIGVVFQDFKLLPSRTVAQNVGYTLDVLGVSAHEVRRRSLAMLRRVGLEHKADASPLKLSGGEQQRVALCRALVNEPAILLADEPTGNLDPAMTVEILDLLTEVNARGTTVLIATHDTALLARYRRRAVRLERGALVGDGAGPRGPR
jgi:cell division transport system ATP-binding protein